MNTSRQERKKKGKEAAFISTSPLSPLYLASSSSEEGRQRQEEALLMCVA